MRTPFGRLVLAGPLLAMSACGAMHQQQGTAELPAGAVALPPDQVERIVARPYSGIAEPQRTVIRDSAAWARFWAEAAGDLVPSLLPPPVAFDQKIAVVVAMGRRRTGGYAITVENVYRAGGRLYVVVKETAPGPGCLVTHALTSPVEVVLLPRTEEPVSFIERREEVAC